MACVVDGAPERLLILDLDRVMSQIGTANKVRIAAYNVKVNTTRLHLFKFKGVHCVHCGREGTYFALETYPGHVSPHLNLYSADNVLMTKDHIVPKCKGGSDLLDNLQTLCVRCNGKKADKPDVRII